MFRVSRGIRPPTIEHMTEKEVKKKVSAETLTFSRVIEITDPSTGFSNIIFTHYYNRRRTNSQASISPITKKSFESGGQYERTE
jgi:hypothetical protein